MKKYRLLIFAFIMSFCTSTTVSLVIVYFNNNDNHFFSSFIQRFLFAWPPAKIAIMGGEQAAKVLYNIKISKLKKR